MMAYNDNAKLGCLGVCANEGKNEFDYYIATGSDKEIPADMSELIVPAVTYVISHLAAKHSEADELWFIAFMHESQLVRLVIIQKYWPSNNQ